MYVLYAESGEFSDHAVEILGVFDTEVGAREALKDSVSVHESYHIAELKLNRLCGFIVRADERPHCCCVLCEEQAARQQYEQQQQGLEAEQAFQARREDFMYDLEVAQLRLQQGIKTVRHLRSQDASGICHNHEWMCQIEGVLIRLRDAICFYEDNLDVHEKVARTSLHKVFASTWQSQQRFLFVTFIPADVAPLVQAIAHATKTM